MQAFRSSSVVVSAVIAIALAACGGSNDSDGAPSLFDSEGKPSAAARQRPSGSPSTRSGLYATSAQYEWEALTAEPYTVLVDLDATGSPASALAKALADHAWADDCRGVAHFVRGGSAEQAAKVADGLSDSGIANVFLIASPD